MKKLSLALMLALSMTACKKKYTQADLDAAKASGKADGYAAGQSDTQANAVKAAAVINAAYADYGVSYNFKLVKFGRDDANFVVISYNSGMGTQYFAIDVSNFSGGFNSYATANPSKVYVNLTANGDGTYKCGSGCTTGNGGAASTSMVFEKTAGTSKDLEKAAAAVESIKAEAMAANIAAEFGLSEERSLKVAKLAASWEALSKTRALTNADADAFAQELAGVDFAQINSAEKAMADGSAAEMNSIISKAAEVNGTTAENMSAIMQKLFF